MKWIHFTYFLEVKVRGRKADVHRLIAKLSPPDHNQLKGRFYYPYYLLSSFFRVKDRQ